MSWDGVEIVSSSVESAISSNEFVKLAEVDCFASGFLFSLGCDDLGDLVLDLLVPDDESFEILAFEAGFVDVFLAEGAGGAVLVRFSGAFLALDALFLLSQHFSSRDIAASRVLTGLKPYAATCLFNSAVEKPRK